MKDLYRGSLVRLSSAPPGTLGKAFAHWDRDTEIRRLADTDPAQLLSERKLTKYFEKREEDRHACHFSLHTLAEDRFIGVLGLIPNDTCEDAWLYIAIYERDFIGKRYGADGLKLILQYGFMELNLRRITLALNSYNVRAFATYQRAGFQLEGRVRNNVKKDGERWDLIYMGILAGEWLAMQEPL